MNKEEAIQELQNQARHHCGEIECYKDGCEKSVELSRAMTIVSRIDEPQKAVVPKFVAEWIEELKESYSSLAWVWQVYPNEPKIKNWLEPNTEKFMRAWLDGYRIEVLEEQVAELKAKPAIIYQVDNAGGAMIGKVTGKAIVDGKHTLDCGVYGRLLVTRELYESVQVGDEIPDFLQGGGN